MTSFDSNQQSSAGALQIDTPVVVLNTFHSGLAIGRDLGRLGIRVIGLTARGDACGNYSKWIEYRASPDSLTHPRELLTCLLALARELGVRAVLLPTRDHDINFLTEHRNDLESNFALPMLPAQRLRDVLNKDFVAAAASEVGICVPDSVTVRQPDELERAAKLQYPCICKPVVATQWRKPAIWDAVGREKVFRVDSFRELESRYRSFSKLDPLVSVQEWVNGEDHNLEVFGSYCSRENEVLASFTARKLLQWPRLAGTGVAVEAVPLPDLEAPARALLHRLKFYGISEIEFKRDERDGRLYLIEINPRHWDQHGLGTGVGVNLSEALYRDVTAQPARGMKQSSERKIWMGDGELARYVLRVVQRKAPVKDLSILFKANKFGSVFDWKDLRPFLSLIGLPVQPHQARDS